MMNFEELENSINKYSTVDKTYGNFYNPDYMVCTGCGKTHVNEEVEMHTINIFLSDSTKPYCSKCSKNIEKLTEYCKVYDPLLLLLLNERVSTIKRSSKSRELTMNIGLFELLELWDKQEGKCAISGIEMGLESEISVYSNGVSVDRIDSTKGYTKDNIQLVCMIVNIMKASMKIDKFIELCKTIAKHNK